MSMAYPAVLSVVQNEWGLSATAAGSISSAYQIGTAVALVVVSALADYINPRIVFTASAGLTAAVSLLIPVLAQGHISALLLFGAVAIAVSGIYTPGIMLLAERFEPRRRGRAVGWFLAASSLGYVIALVVGGLVVARSLRWRWAPCSASFCRSRSSGASARARGAPARTSSGGSTPISRATAPPSS